jgi:hypothetical protein
MVKRAYNTGTLLERTWARVIIAEEDECWVFKGSKGNYGYGQVREGRKLHRAHVVIYESINGPLKTGMKVLHSCDNPPCCNPHHLRSGTQLENVQDMHAKGRARKAKGLENGRAKLSDKQVAEIRYLRGEGIGPTELAKQFGISRYYVYCLISGTDRK